MSTSLLLALLQIDDRQDYVNRLGNNDADKQALLMSQLYDSLTGFYDRSQPGSVLLRASRVGTALTGVVDFHDAVTNHPNYDNTAADPIGQISDQDLLDIVRAVFTRIFFVKTTELVGELRPLLNDRFNAIR